MCTRSNIIGGLQALNWAMGALGVVLFAFGIILVTKEHWSQAYGDVIGRTGGGIIFLSLFMCPITAVGNYGSKNHNKFMLLIYIAVCGFSVFMMLLLGGIILAPTLRLWTAQYQIDCLKTLHEPPKWPDTDDPTADPPNPEDPRCAAGTASTDQQRCSIFGKNSYGELVCTNCHPETKKLDNACLRYMQSDMLQGFKLVWASYHERSATEDDYKQLLIDIQRSGKCCGFGRPFGCVVDGRDFPSKFPSPSEYLYGGQTRQKCGAEQGWYPASGKCNFIVNPNQFPPKYGGCPYELPMGECMNNDPKKENARGCAAEVEKLMQAKVGGLASAILWLVAVPCVAMIVSCCLFLKRKEYDVMPETHPGLNKHRAKDVEVADDDGMIMLQVAEGQHEFIRAFTRMQAECRGTYERLWDEQTFIRVAGEKKQHCEGKGWTKEVNTAFMGTLKMVNEMTTQAQLDAG